MNAPRARYWLVRHDPVTPRENAIRFTLRPGPGRPDSEGDVLFFRIEAREFAIWAIGRVTRFRDLKDEMELDVSFPGGVLSTPAFVESEGVLSELAESDPEVQEIDPETADQILQRVSERTEYDASWIYADAPTGETTRSDVHTKSARHSESEFGEEAGPQSESEGHNKGELRTQRVPPPSSEGKNRRPGVLHLGDSGPEVVQLQRALSSAGYRVLEDGVFGPATDRAVRALQEAAGEKPDGFASAATVRLYERTIQVQRTAGQKSGPALKQSSEQNSSQQPFSEDPPSEQPFAGKESEPEQEIFQQQAAGGEGEAGMADAPETNAGPADSRETDAGLKHSNEMGPDNTESDEDGARDADSDETGAGDADSAESMEADVRRLLDLFPLSQEATSVLEHAARIGMERGWKSLSSSLLLFGLCESVSASHPLFLLVRHIQGGESSERQERVAAVREEYLTTHARSTGASPALTLALEYAAVIAVDTAGPEATPLIDVRHLICALIVVEFEDGELGARRRLRQMGHDPSDLASRLIAEISEAYPDDRMEEWIRHLSAISRPIQPAFDTDGQRVRDEPLINYDRLGIAPDVNAFAKLIAATTVEPPLSIGLFGDWGSGKTFFMRCLQESVASLAKKARETRQPQSALPYYKHVVQIEFNAWHYVESNLWASLVDHILENLCISPDERDGASALKRQEFFIAQLREYEGALKAAKDAEVTAENELDEAQRQYEQVRKKQEEASIDLADTVRSSADVLATLKLPPRLEEKVQALLHRAGIPEVQDAVGQLESELAAHREPLERGNTLLQGLFRQEHWMRHALILIAFIAAVPLLALVLDRIADLDAWLAQLASIAAGVAGFVGVLTDRVKKASVWVRKGVEKAEEAAAWKEDAERVWQELKQEARKKSSALAAEIAAKKQEIEKLKADYIASQTRVQRAREKVIEAERLVRAHSPAQMLARYIETRTASEDYRKHLGILALIRRDFEQLSNLIEVQNRCLVQANEEGVLVPEDVRINRIVLYIDDLDRCPSDRVAEVMQAVHLLLAFPLFVVVVGVDARWLSRSLSRQYQGLLRTDARRPRQRTADDSATPFDYLEKIFQIPLWLNPLDQRGTVAMMDSLLRSSMARPDDSSGDGASEDPEAVVSLMADEQADVSADAGDGSVDTEADAFVADERSAESASPGSPTQTATPPDGSSTPGGSATHDGSSMHGESEAAPELDMGPEIDTEGAHAAETPRAVPELDLSPHSLEIHEHELAFMRELAPIIGRSPRAVKRFVNTYRLIKASLPSARRELFVKERGVDSLYQHVMVLLAVATGLPELSNGFFEALVRADANATVRDVVGEIESRANSEWRRLDRWMERNPAWADLPATNAARQARFVARYSFRVSRLAE